MRKLKEKLFGFFLFVLTSYSFHHEKKSVSIILDVSPPFETKEKNIKNYLFFTLQKQVKKDTFKDVFTSTSRFEKFTTKTKDEPKRRISPSPVMDISNNFFTSFGGTQWCYICEKMFCFCKLSIAMHEAVIIPNPILSPLFEFAPLTVGGQYGDNLTVSRLVPSITTTTTSTTMNEQYEIGLLHCDETLVGSIISPPPQLPSPCELC